MSPSNSAYVVVCAKLPRRRSAPIRVVGPFDNQDDAISWAHAHRPQNPDWLFTPDVLEPPTREDRI